METTLNTDIWSQAPVDAFHWERLPNSKCIWHCRDEKGKSFNRKAKDFNTQSNSLWRDPVKQQEADQIAVNVQNQLKKLNIVLG